MRNDLALGVRVFRIVGVADCLAQAPVELAAVDDHLLRMHGFDGAERHGEVARVLDIHHELRSSMRPDLAYGAERFGVVGDEHLESFLDVVAGHCCLRAWLPLLSIRCTGRASSVTPLYRERRANSPLPKQCSPARPGRCRSRYGAAIWEIERDRCG